MSADLTCDVCEGTSPTWVITSRFGMVWCHCDNTGRRRPTLSEWDALKERCEVAERSLQSERKHSGFVVELHERACHERNALQAERDRAKEAFRSVDTALRNAVKERGDALARLREYEVEREAALRYERERTG